PTRRSSDLLLLDGAPDALDDLGMLDDHSRVRGEDAVVARELRQLVRIDRDQRHRVRLAVAVHHDLADERIGLQEILDVLRRDVHAAGGDDEVLLSVGDEEEAVLVESPDVAAVEPARGLEDLGRRLRLLEIALGDVGDRKSTRLNSSHVSISYA